MRAKLTRPRIFCYKNNVRNIQNGGFIRAKSEPLIHHQARILYLLILCGDLSIGLLLGVDDVIRYLICNFLKTKISLEQDEKLTKREGYFRVILRDT